MILDLRQRELLVRAAAGYTIEQSAADLAMSFQWADLQLGRIRRALGARNTVEAVAAALIGGEIAAVAILRARARRPDLRRDPPDTSKPPVPIGANLGRA
jgi:DNA-binding CsgD family transcriptional regulator